MKETDRKKAAKEFAEYWKERGYEKGESQLFWLSLLSDVLGGPQATKYIKFEEQVKLDRHNGFIDAVIPGTKVLIFANPTVRCSLLFSRRKSI